MSVCIEPFAAFLLSSDVDHGSRVSTEATVAAAANKNARNALNSSNFEKQMCF